MSIKSFTNHATAETLAWFSARQHKSPALDSAIKGSTNPGFKNVQWHHLRGRDAAEFFPWVEYNPKTDVVETTRARRPSKFEYAGVLAVERETVDALVEEHGMRHAVAYKLGRAVMVGTLPEANTFFTENPQNSDQYAVGMRIGSGPLIAHAGVAAGNDFLALTDPSRAKVGVIKVAHSTDLAIV